MDIHRSDFEAEFPAIKRAIQQADFVALDTELSGLHTSTSDRPHSLDDPAMRYQKLRDTVASFEIVQIGIAIFTWNPQPFSFSDQLEHARRNGVYEVKAFNFYLFPTTLNGRAQRDRCFMVQNSAFDFLSRSNFDFNKWVFQGVPYMTRKEQAQYRESRLPEVTGDLPDIEVDSRSQPFVDDVRSQLRQWLDNPKAKPYLNITTTNGYHKRLVHQEVRKADAMLVADGKHDFVQVSRASKEEIERRHQGRLQALNRDMERAVGFTRVIEALVETRKPLLGHNLFLDLCHVFNQFYDVLPPSLDGFKSQLHQLFPCIIDTKLIAETVPQIKDLADRTSLEDLHAQLRKHRYPYPITLLDMQHARYEQAKGHEAGYDAYITGVLFLQLLTIAHTHGCPAPMTLPVDFTTAPVAEFVNRIFLTKSAVSVLNLIGEDEHTVKPNVFYVRTTWPTLTADDYQLALGDQLGQFFLNPLTADSVFITFSLIPSVLFQMGESIEYLLETYCKENKADQSWQGTVMSYAEYAKARAS
ncbi:hypothetical protein H4R35_004320 [Dimargaris xerosporica]|nr:hypothetical protein H4R35_004320 [Dimargaris xerosporica]